jgi:hypothetical protein
MCNSILRYVRESSDTERVSRTEIYSAVHPPYMYIGQTVEYESSRCEVLCNNHVTINLSRAVRCSSHWQSFDMNLMQEQGPREAVRGHLERLFLNLRKT